MQIVLTRDVPNLGQKGDIKNVKPGYFRNFLAPRAKALRVTPKLMQQIKDHQKQREIRREALMAKAEDFAKKIESMTVTFKQKATAKGKLYASITEKNIQAELEKHLKIDLDKHMVKLPEHLKEVGEFIVGIQLSDTVSANLKVVVKAEK